MNFLRTSMLAAPLLALPMLAGGQTPTQPSVSNSMPTSNFGFNLPTHLGSLSYSLTGSEILETGYGSSSVGTNTVLSGNVAYISRSQNNPFSLVYSGGYLFSTIPGSNSSNTFQNLAASQVLRTRSWVYVISDAVSYMPESPTTGLSGIAGVGDIGVYPVQTGLGPAQDIFTNYANRLTNGVQGSATWQVTPSFDLEGSGGWDVMRFQHSASGLDSNEYEGSFGPNYRIDARNQIGASAYYQRITYPNYSLFKLETEGVNISYTRAWTRRLSTSVAMGPETTHGQTISPIRGQLSFSGTASLSYATRTTAFTAGYSRQVNAGSGVIFGSIADSVTLAMNRPLSRNWIFGLNTGYTHSKSLTSYFGAYPSYDSIFGGVQLSRKLTESLSAYGSYTALDQSANNSQANGLIYSGLSHIFAFGITFAPQPLLRGH